MKDYIYVLTQWKEIEKYEVRSRSPKRIVAYEYWYGKQSARTRHFDPDQCFELLEDALEARRRRIEEEIGLLEESIESARKQLTENPEVKDRSS